MEVFRLRLYKPHSLQLKIHHSKARFKILVAGRQVGKSTFCNMEMLKKAWEKPKTRYAFVSPIFSQAKEQYRRMIAAIPKDIIKNNSDSELRIELINESVMEYLSGDNPHSIRGKTLDGVLIDEVRDHSPELWGQVIRPMLATTGGWAIMSSTPAGYDYFYDLAEKAKTDKDWEVFHGASTCNPLFTQDEYEAAKREMSEAEFDQEINANFRDLKKGKVYYSFSDENILAKNPFAPNMDVNPYLPVELYMDFNVRNMGWALAQFRNGHGHYFFDEIFGFENTHTAIEEFIHRFKSLNILANPGVVLVGDASGKSQKTSAAGETDYSIIHNAFKRSGINFNDMTPDSNPHVKDRVTTMNTRFKSAEGIKSIWVHPKCKYLIRDFQRVVWKDTSTGAMLDQVTDRSMTHLSDAAGYGVYVRHGVVNEGGVGQLRMIRR